MNHHPLSSSSTSSSSSSNHVVANNSILKATTTSHGEVNQPFGWDVAATVHNNNNNNNINRSSAVVERPEATSIANNNESAKENNLSYCIPDPVQHHHNDRSFNGPCRPPCRTVRRPIHFASRSRTILRERQRDIPEQMLYNYPPGHHHRGRHTRTLRQQHRRMRRSVLVTANNNNNVHDDAGYDGDNEMCKGGRYDCNKGTVYNYRNEHINHEENNNEDSDVSRLFVHDAIEVDQRPSLLGTPTGQVKRSSPGPLSHSSFQAKRQRLPEHREVRSILKGLRDQVDKTFANVTELNKLFDEVTELGKRPPLLDICAVPQLPVETSPRHSPPPPDHQMYHELLSLSEILSPPTPDSDVTEQPPFQWQDQLQTPTADRLTTPIANAAEEASLRNAYTTTYENHAIDRIDNRNDDNNNNNNNNNSNHSTGDSMNLCSNSNRNNDENNITGNSMNRRHNTDNDNNNECDVAGICDNNNNESTKENNIPYCVLRFALIGVVVVAIGLVPRSPIVS